SCTACVERADTRPAALEQLVPAGRHQAQYRHKCDAGTRWQAALGPGTRRPGPRGAAAIRSHLAVGARLRGRRAASRFAATLVALAHETTRSRGRSAAA